MKNCCNTDTGKRNNIPMCQLLNLLDISFCRVLVSLSLLVPAGIKRCLQASQITRGDTSTAESQKYKSRSRPHNDKINP